MIGFYDYSVWLTYLSALSGAVGIVVCLWGNGHPYLGTMFLLLSGLCDAFDGIVARTKKDRSPAENSFGIQIDSLADLIAFGVLPVCIGFALYRSAAKSGACALPGRAVLIVLLVLGALYVLAALIRLAYYNVTEAERQRTESGVRAHYTGLPVTSAAIVFPAYMALQYLLPVDLTIGYFPLLIVVAAAFLLRFQVKKLKLKAILILVGIGAIEFAVIVIGHLLGA